MKDINKLLILLFFLLLPQLVVFLGLIFVFPAIENWYQYLKKTFSCPFQFYFRTSIDFNLFLMGITSFLFGKTKKILR